MLSLKLTAIDRYDRELSHDKLSFEAFSKQSFRKVQGLPCISSPVVPKNPQSPKNPQWEFRGKMGLLRCGKTRIWGLMARTGATRGVILMRWCMECLRVKVWRNLVLKWAEGGVQVA